jgi:hypothetical protein
LCEQVALQRTEIGRTGLEAGGRDEGHQGAHRGGDDAAVQSVLQAAPDHEEQRNAPQGPTGRTALDLQEDQGQGQDGIAERQAGQFDPAAPTAIGSDVVAQRCTAQRGVDQVCPREQPSDQHE